MRRWLAAVGIGPDDAADVLLACGEAVANAVEHAYSRTVPGVAGELAVELRLSAGWELTVRVADTGRWREVPAPGTGAGGCR